MPARFAATSITGSTSFRSKSRRFARAATTSCSSPSTSSAASPRRRASRRRSSSAGAASKLKAYAWPGNVRELRNVVERLAILLQSDTIEPEDIHLGTHAEAPVEIAPNLPLREARDEFEKQYILSRLREFAGNVCRTADALGVERSNLYRKLNAYGIRVERP